MNYGQVPASGTKAVNGVVVIPDIETSSISQPGAPVESSDPVRNRICAFWPA